MCVCVCVREGGVNRGGVKTAHNVSVLLLVHVLTIASCPL